MLQLELKALRDRKRWTLRKCGKILNISYEYYRRMELPPGHPKHVQISGFYLAKLAEAAGLTIPEAFPSYEPTDDELALIRHLSPAA